MALKNLDIFDTSVKSLVGVLSPKGREVIIQRYGLNPSAQSKTLQAIGNKYGITRERIRQIEDVSIIKIKKSEEYLQNQRPILILQNEIENRGKVVREDLFLREFSEEPYYQNIAFFFLEIADQFYKIKESEEFFPVWTIDRDYTKLVFNFLRKVYGELSTDEKVLKEREMFELGKHLAEDFMNHKCTDEALHSWFVISRLISKNPFGEWGPSDSSLISPRGMRDLAYLVLEKQNKPLHFTELAGLIAKSFAKKAHIQTVHNELIKSPDFVLVGRGLYALKKWGYEPGIAKDVIIRVLKEEGPLPKEKITKEVLKQRFLKPETIFTNLQDKKYFRKREDGAYELV